MKTRQFLTAILLASALITFAKPTKNSIVILYENDVHCAIDGYAKMAGLRNAISDTADVVLVSSGDYVQGGTVGAISKGRYIADIMRKMKYDAVTLGNHEFDFSVKHTAKLLRRINTHIVCANLFYADSEKTKYSPFYIKKAGNKKVAFIGVVTPTTMYTEASAFYEKGKQVYDLHEKDIYKIVQNAADKARAKGADYVVVLSHLGEMDNDSGIDSHGLVAATNGIDAVLDGHSHNTIPSDFVNNKDGKPVPVTQTGTKFANVGKLTITPDGKITTELIPAEKLSKTDVKVASAAEKVKAKMDAQINRVICQSDVDLHMLDGEGRQLVRFDETNLGDLVTDAYRLRTGADIALANGGGIRTEIKAGKLTYGDIAGILPYENYVVVVDAKGSTILELLRQNTALLPVEDGFFPQVSGMKYTVVVADHSIKDVQILNKATGSYEPIDPDKNYTVATIDYCVSGGGFRYVLKDAKILTETNKLYRDMLVDYISDNLKAHIGSQYAEPQGRITIIYPAK